MTRVLVLTEQWFPQGGGAEFATFLYVRKLIEAGHSVTIATNDQAILDDLSDSCSHVKLSLPEVKRMKPGLLARRRTIQKELYSIAKKNETIYIPGKLLFLAPWLRRVNASSRIIAHLHDYQFVCPHASLLNMMGGQHTCDSIWSNINCARCTRNFLIADGNSVLSSAIGSLTSYWWKNVANVKNILDSIDLFITVSTAQGRLISYNLRELSHEFERKNIALYNPIDFQMGHIPLSSRDKPYLAFFGGNRFHKGFKIALEMFQQLQDNLPSNLIATNMESIVKGDNVECFGHIDSAQVAEEYKKIWMVLLTSIWEETSSYVVVESQLRGRPIIASDIGGVPENIARYGVTGSLFKTNDYERFKETTESYYELLHSNPQQYTEEISNISKDFFVKRSVGSYDAFLRNIS